MKVLQTIQGLASLSGGPSTCTRDLMDGLCELGVDVDLYTLKCSDVNDYNLGQGSQWLIEDENDYYSPLYISRNTKTFLENSDYDIYHTNGMWMYCNHETCVIARKKKRPYIVTTHGMLYSNALLKSRYRKAFMLKLWFNKDVHSASCLHATCYQELEHLRKYGYKGPIAVIPNPVIFPDGVNLKSLDYDKEINGLIQFGILARLNPIKKIENVLYAAHIVLKEQSDLNFEIVIMGKGNSDYESFLRQETERLHLSERVKFIGFVNGDEKYRRLSQLRALFVPSESENFGMIVPEALICGTVVCASLGTPWNELNEHKCGWWCDNSPETIAKVMRESISISKKELVEMGTRGRKLIEGKYSQSSVAGMMNELYHWVYNNKSTNKPSFVYE